MTEEIAFENVRISNFEGLVTFTYMPNFIEIKGTFCGRTDGRTYNVRTERRTFETGFIRSTLKGRPKNVKS